MYTGQKIARLKKIKYQNLGKNLMTMIKAYQSDVIIGSLRGCTDNIKL